MNDEDINWNDPYLQDVSENDWPVPDGYEMCSYCGGHGLVLNYWGEPDECPECGGSCIVPINEENGEEDEV